MSLGLIHIYCGDGKGKTTAAMGLILRAVGREKRVLLTQFLKSGRSGELIALERYNDYVEFIPGRPVGKFVWNMNEEEKQQATIEHTERFNTIIDKVSSGKYDILVLDELIGTINNGFISVNDVVSFLKNKPKNLEVVMTGRNPKEELIEIADYVSEIKAIKHPFNDGIPARIGIEE